MRSDGADVSGTVEMFRDAAEVHGRDRFSCPIAAWALVWELGQAFGWQPKGTTYLSPPKRPVETPALRNYQPGDAQDYKRVEADDATAWARALEVAKHSPHFAAMVNARSVAMATSGELTGELLAGVLDEFIEFAYGGAFTFAVSPDKDISSDKR